MIAERDKSTLFDKRREAVHLLLDFAARAREDMLVETTHHQQVFAVLATIANWIRAPRADFEREHTIDADIKPMRKQLVDLAVAIEPHDINAVLV